MTTVSAVAQDKPAKEPANLVKARADYEAKVKAATDPIKAEYVKKLTEMMKAYGAAGDLESAKMVQDEIKSLSTTPPTLTGKWSWIWPKSTGTAEFFPDGTAKHSSGTQGKWHLVKDRKYSVLWATGYLDTVTLAPDGATLTMRSQSDNQGTGARLP